MPKRLAITLLISFLLFLGTVAAILWAKGYRLNLKRRTLEGTGLLVVNSYPTGAPVYLNGKITTATDDTLHLPPGDYQIKIVKDGFSPWVKTVRLESELVTQTNARLFPSVPDLTALTFTGAINPTLSPNGQKIAYAVASASADLKNGLWIINLSDSPIKFGSNQVQIAQNTANTDFSRAKLFWSPNSQQILASLPNGTHYLLSTDSLNAGGDLKEVTARLSFILEEWQQDSTAIQQKKLEKLPLFMQQVATTSAQSVYFSPDETKVLYLATSDLVIPEKLIPPLPASTNQPEERHIKPSQAYVYDLKEDKNFFIKTIDIPKGEKAETIKATTSKPTQELLEEKLEKLQSSYAPIANSLPQWLPTSRHLVFNEDSEINIIEYDGTNLTQVYMGPFEDNFVYPWPSGNKLVILTSLSSPITNLYAINLR